MTPPTVATRTTAGASTGTPVRGSGVPVRRRRRVEPIFWFFLVPALVLFTLCITVPAVMGIFMSFTNSIGFGAWDFVGLQNYAVMFTDPAVLSSYGFTIGIAVVTAAVVNLIAFFLAMGLTSRIHFSAALKSTFVIPMVISVIVISYVFSYLFSNTLPAIGQRIGFGPLETSILADSSTAWIGIVFVTAWQAIPATLLIYIAGLLSIPGDVYEAASLDGANRRQRLWHVTLPLVAGYIVINVILTFKNFLNSYDVIVGLTQGGPGTSTRTVAMTIVQGFNEGDYAYQMANATVFFVIAIAIAFLQLRLNRTKA